MNHIQFPDKKVAQSKFITVIIMIVIILALYWASYIFFLRTIEVDIIADAQIQYQGESGNAIVKVKNIERNYNQRIQEFMDSIVYSVTPNTNLKNGDLLTITTTYNKEIARRYNIKAIHKTSNKKVSGLPVRYANGEEVSKPFLNKITKRSKGYLNSNMKNILKGDFITFKVETQPKLHADTFLYRIFLDAKADENKDKIIDVYALDASATQEENGEKRLQTERIFYTVTYNEINTSQTLRDENIYGEKLIITNEIDLTNYETFQAFMQNRYATMYDLLFLDIK